MEGLELVCDGGELLRLPVAGEKQMQVGMLTNLKIIISHSAHLPSYEDISLSQPSYCIVFCRITNADLISDVRLLALCIPWQ
jgi:hypothetical protein